jgi:altronate dehydratase small subunit
VSARATGSGAAGPEPEGPLAVTLILLAGGDDVLVAARDLAAGVHRTSAGGTAVVREPIPLGHKVAARDLAKGEHVVRAGMSIGSTTAAVQAGEWVHTHNLASDYIATYAHRGGER